MMQVVWLVFVLFMFASCNSNKPETQSSLRDITPTKDYAMLIVESQSCIYCKQLDKDLKSIQYLRDKATQLDVYKIDVESNARVKYRLFGEENITTESSLARKLGVSSFPYIFFYDAQGNIILSLPGYVPPKTLACIIDYVKDEEYQRSNLNEYLKNKEC